MRSTSGWRAVAVRQSGVAVGQQRDRAMDAVERQGTSEKRQIVLLVLPEVKTVKTGNKGSVY